MDTFLSALFTGTSRGAIYALVAIGLVLVWRGAGVVNSWFNPWSISRSFGYETTIK